MDTLMNVLVWLALGLVVGAAIGIVFLQHPSAVPSPQPQLPPANVTPPPPAGNSTQQNTTIQEKSEVNMTLIEAPDCPQCNAGGQLLDEAKTVLLQSKTLKAGASRTINASSEEGQALIARYNLTELPALVIEGPVSLDSSLLTMWSQQSIGTQEGPTTLVTRLRTPPYYDIANRTAVGLLQVIGIKAAGCMECGDPEIMVASMEGPTVGIAFGNATYYNENDTEAKALIARYNITKVPALLISSGLYDYPAFSQIQDLGSKEDGWFVFRKMAPPYIDLTANRTLRGLVTAVLLNDSGCSYCFDVTGLSDYIAQSAGLVIVNTTGYDISSGEGRALVKRYNITHVPTVIYSPEVAFYPGFADIWLRQNSTIDPDGWFVFRAHALLGNKTQYENISAG